MPAVELQACDDAGGERILNPDSPRSPETIAREAAALLGDRSRVDDMRRRLVRLRPMLGRAGASRRAAEEVARTLNRGEAQ